MRRLLFFLVIVFFIIGGYIIKTSYDINFHDKQEVVVFGKEFVKWVFHIGKNTAEITAQAVKEAVNKTWLPEVNKTEINETDNK